MSAVNVKVQAGLKIVSPTLRSGCFTDFAIGWRIIRDRLSGKTREVLAP